MLEQRDDVGERLVEGEHVGIGPLLKAGMQPVEQRMRGLVRDDVVRRPRRTLAIPAASAPYPRRGARK